MILFIISKFKSIFKQKKLELNALNVLKIRSRWAMVSFLLFGSIAWGGVCKETDAYYDGTTHIIIMCMDDRGEPISTYRVADNVVVEKLNIELCWGENNLEDTCGDFDACNDEGCNLPYPFQVGEKYLFKNTTAEASYFYTTFDGLTLSKPVIYNVNKAPTLAIGPNLRRLNKNFSDFTINFNAEDANEDELSFSVEMNDTSILNASLSNTWDASSGYFDIPIQISSITNKIGSVKLTIFAKDTSDAITSETVILKVTARSLPSATNVAFLGKLKEGETLTGNYTYTDRGTNRPIADESGTTFAWYRSDDASGTNKRAILGATAKTYLLSLSDEGKYISFEVTPKNVDEIGTAVESSINTTSVKANILPTITSTPVTLIGKNLSYTYALYANDSDGDSLSWSVTNGTTLPSWLNLNLEANLSGTPTTTGTYDVHLTLTDGLAEVAHDFQIIVNDSPPAVTNVMFSGKLEERETLTGSYLYSDINSDEESGTTFAWYRSDDASGTNKRAIVGATAKTYLLVLADGDKYISFEVTPKNVEATGTAVESSINTTPVKAILRPTVTSTPVTITEKGRLYIYMPTATDANNDTLTWSVTSGETLPSWLSLNSTTEVTTVAGNGGRGSTDGRGTTASFNNPRGIAIDSSGNLFVADTYSNKIRKITPTGDVTTFAGTGNSGSTSGWGEDASFNYPKGIAIDSSGNLFVADTDNHKIRKITPNGVVRTFAGNGSRGSTDGISRDASFRNPSGIAIDSSGNLFVADTSNNKIRKITPSGEVTTFAGSGKYGFADGSGINASFNSPNGIAIDSSGNLFVADSGNKKIRKITPSGEVTTFAGSGKYGFADGRGTTASFNNPMGIAIDSSGNLFVADSGNKKIRKITPSGEVTTFTDSGTAASFDNPSGIAIDSSENIFVTDGDKIKRIVRPTLTGIPTTNGVYDVHLTLSNGIVDVAHDFQITVVSRITGVVANQAVNDNATLRPFSTIILAYAENDNISVTITLDDDTKGSLSTTTITNGTIAEVQATLRAILFTPTPNRVAGGATETTTITITVNDGTTEVINNTTTVVSKNINDTPVITSTPMTSIDENSIYSYRPTATDADNYTLTWSVTSGEILPSWLSLNNTLEVTTFAGSGTAALFNKPKGLAIDSSGNIFVADTDHNRIRKITPNGEVTIFAGSGSSGDDDGFGIAASFRSPYAIVIDSSDNLFVADSNNNKIRKITPSGEVTTFAGSGYKGSSNDTPATFYTPTGLAIDSDGNIFVADSRNNQIRKITPSGVVTTFAGSGSYGFANGSGTAALFRAPTGIAIDSSKNLFVTDSMNNKIRKITPSGEVTTFAGSGSEGSYNANGIVASFKRPRGIAIDSSGNLFVADFDNDKIRKITPNGVVTTFAGSGSRGSADGSGTAASFKGPNGIAIDDSGNLFVADTYNSKIRKIVRTTTLTGTPKNSDVGVHDVDLTVTDGIAIVADNFQITVVSKITGVIANQAVDDNATLRPFSTIILAYAKNDNISVTITLDDDTKGSLSTTTITNGTIAEVQATLRAILFTPTPNRVAGGATETTTITITVNDGTTEVINNTTTVVSKNINDTPVITSTPMTSIDENSIYSYRPTATDADNYTLTWSVTSGEILPSWLSLNNTLEVTTFAGSGRYGSVDGNGTDTSFSYPQRIAIDGSGNIFVTDKAKIRKITPSGEVTTFAGKGKDGSDDGIGTDASFRYPIGIAIDSSGNLFVADSGNNKVRKITPSGEVITFAGSGSYNSTDGRGRAASFNRPEGVTIDSSGNIFIADTAGHKIRKITPSGEVTTFAGSGEKGSSDGNGTNASFNSPRGIAIDSSGNIFIADTAGHKIRKIIPSGEVTTFAGSGSRGSADGNGIVASFYSPTEIAIDSSGNLFVADTHNSEIRKITPNGEVTTLACPPLLKFPTGIAIDSSGNIFIADTDHNKIRKIVIASTTLTGTPTNSDVGVYDIKLTVSDGTVTVADNFQITVETTTKPVPVAPSSGGSSSGGSSSTSPVAPSNDTGETATPSNDTVEAGETVAKFDDAIDADVDKSDDTTTTTINIYDKKVAVAINDSGTMSGKVELEDKNGNPIATSVKIDLTKSETSVDAKGNINTTAKTDSGAIIKTTLGIDGSAKVEVKSENGATTTATSNIPGSTVVVDSKGNIETTSTIEKDGFKYKATVITDAEGKTKTKLVTVDLATGKEIITGSDTNAVEYEAGSRTTIKSENGKITIEVEVKMTQNIRFK